MFISSRSMIGPACAQSVEYFVQAGPWYVCPLHFATARSRATSVSLDVSIVVIPVPQKVHGRIQRDMQSHLSNMRPVRPSIYRKNHTYILEMESSMNLMGAILLCRRDGCM